MGTKISEATLREILKGSESLPIVDTDLPKGRTTIDILKEYVQPDLSSKQDKLVSGTNIKTVNGESILGSGDLAIENADNVYVISEEVYNIISSNGTLDLDKVEEIKEAVINKKCILIAESYSDEDGNNSISTYCTYRQGLINNSLLSFYMLDSISTDDGNIHLIVFIISLGNGQCIYSNTEIPLATEDFVNKAVAGLVNSAPDALDTLKELADALGNDADFANTVTRQIGGKLDTSTYNSDKESFATKTELGTKVSGTGVTKMQVVTELPESPDASTLYILTAPEETA